MFFDCMALGVGLFASVMATWKPNESFTYGFVLFLWRSCGLTSAGRRLTLAPLIYTSRYGRVETLSGFANGVFLILISIFIVFEAIQRMYVLPICSYLTLSRLNLSTRSQLTR
jgi:zinc transporter 5/7